MSITAKADKAKRRARFAVMFLTAATALIPVLILVSTQHARFVFGQLLPSVLAAAAALGAGWVQIQRPHERWNLYRRYQRVLEAERLHYRYKTGDYGDAASADNTLIERLAQIQLDLHHESGWLEP